MGPKTNDSSTRRTAALVLLTVALVITGLAALTAPVMAEAPAPNPGTANFETKFMTDMIDHHAMAVHMLRCVSRKQFMKNFERRARRSSPHKARKSS